VRPSHIRTRRKTFSPALRDDNPLGITRLVDASGPISDRTTRVISAERHEHDDYAVFVIYIVATLVLGFAAGRKARGRPRDYFLGEKKLPWYGRWHIDGRRRYQQRKFIANSHRVPVWHGGGYAKAGIPGLFYSNLSVCLSPYYVAVRPIYHAASFSSCVQLDLPIPVRDFTSDRLLFTLLAGSLYAGRFGIERIF